MRLSRLTGLEHEKLAKEYARAVRRHRPLPRHPREPQAPRRRHRHGARGDQGQVRRQAPHRDRRRTRPRSRRRTSSRKRTWSSPSRTPGYIKRTSPKDYRAQKRGGKGRIGMEAREEDWVTQLFVVSTHAYVFFFSDKGKVYVKKVYEIPLARAHEQGPRDRELHRDRAGREGRGDRARAEDREGQVRRHADAGRARSRRPSSTSTRTSARRASSASRSTRATSSSTRR